MPFALITIGLVLIAAGVKDTQWQLRDQLIDDMTGGTAHGEKPVPGFLIWIAALFGIGALGYIKGLEKFSRLFLVLILLVMVLANGGLFQRLGIEIATARSLGPINPAAVGSANPDAPAADNPNEGLTERDLKNRANGEKLMRNFGAFGSFFAERLGGFLSGSK